MNNNTIEDDIDYNELENKLKDINDIIDKTQNKLEYHNKEINKFKILNIIKNSILSGLVLTGISTFWTIISVIIIKILQLVAYTQNNLYLLYIMNGLFFITGFVVATAIQIYNYYINKEQKTYYEIKLNISIEAQQKIKEELKAFSKKRDNINTNQHKYTYNQEKINNIKKYINSKTNKKYEEKKSKKKVLSKNR